MMKTLTKEVRVGKKYAIYLPKSMVKAIGLKEGERVILKMVDNGIMLECVKDPLELALSGRKFASVEPEEVEVISLEEQAGRIEGSP